MSGSINNADIINRLLTIEAGAEVLKKECRKARKLIEESVSTDSKPERAALTDDQIAERLKKRHARQFKTNLKIA